ncbi:MAG: hypothetical protein ACE5GX_05945 [Thermoanaerobaculia bacterium]
MSINESSSQDDREFTEKREDRDLGFGAVVATESQKRLLNRDGSFNVERHGLGWRSTLSLYHSLLEMSSPRFSRPVASIVFSRNAIIAPYRGITAFEFRIANRRKSQIIDLEAKPLLSRWEHDSKGAKRRRFYQLELERRRVTFFPLAWTIVHPIDDDSPLRKMHADDLAGGDAEFLVLLTGIDETFSQMVHARSSYKWDEVTWSHGFESIFERPTADAPLAIDVSRIHETKPAA